MGAPVGGDRLAAARRAGRAVGRGGVAEGPGHGRREPRPARGAEPHRRSGVGHRGERRRCSPGIIAGFLARRSARSGPRPPPRGCTGAPPIDWSRPTAPGSLPAIWWRGWVVRCRSWECSPCTPRPAERPTTGSGGQTQAARLHRGARSGARSISTRSGPTSPHCARSPRPQLLAVVKANGYGHGAVPVARAPHSMPGTTRGLGVARVEEGESSCASAGLDAPILLLSEPAPEAAATGGRGRPHPSRLHPVAGSSRSAKRPVAASGMVRAARRPPQGRHPGMHRVGCARTTHSRSVSCDAAAHLDPSSSSPVCAPISQSPTSPPTRTPPPSWRPSARCSPRSTPCCFCWGGGGFFFFFFFFFVVVRTPGAARCTHFPTPPGCLRDRRRATTPLRVGIATATASPWPAPAVADAGPRSGPRCRSASAGDVLLRMLRAGDGSPTGCVTEVGRRSRVATVPGRVCRRRAPEPPGSPVVRCWSGVGGVPIIGMVTMDPAMLVLLRRSGRRRPTTRSCCSDVRATTRSTAAEWGGRLGTISYEVVTGIGPPVPRRYRRTGVVDGSARALPPRARAGRRRPRRDRASGSAACGGRSSLVSSTGARSRRRRCARPRPDEERHRRPPTAAAALCTSSRGSRPDRAVLPRGRAVVRVWAKQFASSRPGRLRARGVRPTRPRRVARRCRRASARPPRRSTCAPCSRSLGLRGAILVGHSMGGIAVQSVVPSAASRRLPSRVGGLVLLATSSRNLLRGVTRSSGAAATKVVNLGPGVARSCRTAPSEFAARPHRLRCDPLARHVEAARELSRL